MKEMQFYVHRSYINTYYKVYQTLEQWISSNVFRNDTSRVFLASDEYAFRRRFELTDMSKAYDEIQASSLQFPFANYAPQNVGWEADTRIAGNTAQLVYEGIYEGNTKIKAVSSILKVPVTFYFDREDDARFCYEILYAKSFNEHYYSTTIPYGANILGLPVNILIQDIQFNPKYTESDWLRQNKIFIISSTFNLRSYVVIPPNQPNYNETVDAYGKLSDGSYYDDGIPYYETVDDVILNFDSFAWKYVVYDGVDKFPKEGNSETIYVDASTPEKYEDNSIYVKGSFPTINPKKYRWVKYLKKYEEYNPCKFTSLRADGILDEGNLLVDSLNIVASYNSASITWQAHIEGVDESSNIIGGQNTSSTVTLVKIELVLSSSIEPIAIDLTSTSVTIEDLVEGSHYEGYLAFYLSDGSSKKVGISFNTIKSTVQEEDKISLVGYKW